MQIMAHQKKIEGLAISDAKQLIFGTAPRPVECGHGLVIGGGEVYPEISFTLPPMTVDETSWKDVRKQYSTIIEDICQRSVELETPGLVVEYELLPPMTLNPRWGAEITEILRSILDRFYDKYELRSVLRVTPVDVRDAVRPPRMRRGEFWEKTYRSFELCAAAGADLLAIESTGGKELHDDALMNGDLAGIVFALGVLAVRDTRFLWKHIVKIGADYDSIPSGDTACGFANTAMILAEKGMIPRVLAAVDRVASVVRTLQVHLVGAVGPTKDCAYEGPFLKALTGVPISMEGKSAACAHLSPLGNIAGACCDLWSNESVQNVRMLSTDAPVVSLEQLVYDCRLMNQAKFDGSESARQLQKWLVNSDAYHDPQAFVLHPEFVMRMARGLLDYNSPLEQVLYSVGETLRTLREVHDSGKLKLAANDRRWLDLLEMQLESIPSDAERLKEQILAGPQGSKFLPTEYGL